MTDIGRAGMVMKGDYNSASTYETLDAVSYNNALYIAKQNVPAGTTPANTAYWQLAVAANVDVVVEILGTLSSTETTQDFTSQYSPSHYVLIGLLNENSFNMKDAPWVVEATFYFSGATPTVHVVRSGVGSGAGFQVKGLFMKYA